MRRVFISSDLCPISLPWKKHRACRCATPLVPILFLVLCSLSASQVIQSSPAVEGLSTSASPENSNQQSADFFSTSIPIQRQPVLNGPIPLGCPAETNSQALQTKSDLSGNAPSRQADCSSSLNRQQQRFNSILPSLDESNRSDSTANCESSKSVAALIKTHEHPDINAEIYRRNRLDFALDVGWHPVNIPFIYDFAVGDSYNMTPLKYTLVPIIASLRWQVTNVGWPWIFRGNMDFTFSGSVTAIPRGPETHYFAFMFGIRRNFVHPNWKAVPFFEQRGGAGMINAKEPLGVLFAQGQNLTFTYNLGVGVRYNLNTKYSFSAGMNYMHISNGYLSQPQFTNYGINVYGPMFGLDMRLSKPRHGSQ